MYIGPRKETSVIFYDKVNVLVPLSNMPPIYEDGGLFITIEQSFSD